MCSFKSSFPRKLFSGFSFAFFFWPVAKSRWIIQPTLVVLQYFCVIYNQVVSCYLLSAIWISSTKLESSVCVILLSVGGVLAEASSYELCISRSISRFIHCNRSRRHPVINNHNKYFTIILKCRHSMNRSICKYPFTLTRMRNHVCYRIFNHGWMFYANLLWITTKHI